METHAYKQQREHQWRHTRTSNNRNINGDTRVQATTGTSMETHAYKQQREHQWRHTRTSNNGNINGDTRVQATTGTSMETHAYKQQWEHQRSIREWRRATNRVRRHISVITAARPASSGVCIGLPITMPPMAPDGTSAVLTGLIHAHVVKSPAKPISDNGRHRNRTRGQEARRAGEFRSIKERYLRRLRILEKLTPLHRNSANPPLQARCLLGDKLTGRYRRCWDSLIRLTTLALSYNPLTDLVPHPTHTPPAPAPPRPRSTAMQCNVIYCIEVGVIGYGPLVGRRRERRRAASGEAVRPARSQ
jgi:hypothetical protein